MCSARRYFVSAGGQTAQVKDSQLNELFDKLKGEWSFSNDHANQLLTDRLCQAPKTAETRSTPIRQCHTSRI